MNAAAPLMLPALETTLTLLNGPEKGATYRIVSARISLGRGADNDIVLQDPKVSRHHAEIRWTESGFEIRDLSEKNIILIDGRECHHSLLADGVKVQLGRTAFRFNMQASQAIAPTLIPQADLTKVGLPHPAPRQSRKRPPQGSLFRWVVIGVIGLALYIGLATDGPQKKKIIQLRTQQQIDEAIREAQDSKTKDLSDRQRTANDFAYQQAQESYVVGFRDYKKGQYERAMLAFQACVSLNPSHTLCQRYFRLAQRKFNELVQYHMVLGHKYRDQNQFASCRAAYRNVMTMVKDPNNSTYKEAKANFEACDAQLEDRF